MVLLVFSLCVVTLGAEILVRGASTLALRTGVSPLFVGLTIVGFGTSTPELGASLAATAAGSGDVSVGNIVGSNIFNIAVILGVTANLDALLGPWIADLIGRRIPGLGLAATAALVRIVGVVATNYIGARAISAAEKVFARLPFVRRIYSASKEIVESATLSKRGAFRDVVMVEYPRRGLFSYGFVTSYTVRRDGEEAKRLANVFVPGPPVPTTGVLVAVPVEELFYLDVPIEEALKLILSGGMAAPAELRARGRP